jgi:hypothetical protein
MAAAKTMVLAGFGFTMDCVAVGNFAFGHGKNSSIQCRLLVRDGKAAKSVAMYIFLDEIGNLQSTGAHFNEGVFGIGALVIRSNKSRRRIFNGITRVGQIQRKDVGHKNCKTCQLEVKGSHLRPRSKRKLFRKISKCADAEFFCLIVDKRKSQQRLAQRYSRRYNLAVANLLARIPIHRCTTRVNVVIDKGGSTTKRQRNALQDMIKAYIIRTGRHIAVHVRESHFDRGLQAVDVLIEFSGQGYEFKLESQQQIGDSSAQAVKRAERFRKQYAAWKSLKQILTGKVHLWTVPPVPLRRVRLGSIVVLRLKKAGKLKYGGNRRR